MTELFEARLFQFDQTSGYGFVRDPEGGDQDVFVHANEFHEEDRLFLRDGALISFEVVSGERGLRAEQASVIREERDLHSIDYRNRLTDALIASDPTLTTAQLDNVRRAALDLANQLGLLEA